jgi:predicted TIM-barrel fold metal-dependent hydrolase
MYDTFENAAVWGSHYPAQNTTPAALALEQLSRGGVPDAAIRKMMSDNAARTYHISLTAAR